MVKCLQIFASVAAAVSAGALPEPDAASLLQFKSQKDRGAARKEAHEQHQEWWGKERREARREARRAARQGSPSPPPEEEEEEVEEEVDVVEQNCAEGTCYEGLSSYVQTHMPDWTVSQFCAYHHLQTFGDDVIHDAYGCAWGCHTQAEMASACAHEEEDAEDDGLEHDCSDTACYEGLSSYMQTNFPGRTVANLCEYHKLTSFSDDVIYHGYGSWGCHTQADMASACACKVDDGHMPVCDAEAVCYKGLIAYLEQWDIKDEAGDPMTVTQFCDVQGLVFLLDDDIVAAGFDQAWNCQSREELANACACH